MLCISNHTACRFAEKSTLFPLKPGRVAPGVSRFTSFKGKTLFPGYDGDAGQFFRRQQGRHARCGRVREGSMKKCMDAANLHRRINKIIGQLKAIDGMIDEDVPCEDVLIQINAAKGALHKVGQIVLEGHLQHCVRDGIEHGDADATIAAFARAIDHFARKA